MASLQGLPTPTIDWTDRSIDAAFENFRETCTLIFDGPLAEVADKIKVNYLKLWAGEEGRRIIKTWQMTDDEAKKLDTYWGKFKDYVKPKSNFRIARYKLRECKQTDSEPVDVFVKRLRTILAECKYPKEQQEVHLLDAMIFGIKLEKVQSQLLQHDETLTVDQALMLARTEEATRQQIEELRGITKPVDVIRKPAGHAGKTRPRQHPQAKNAPQEKLPPRVPPNKGQPTCGNCGRQQHRKSENCPARGLRCSNCQKLGHWSNVCRSEPRESRRKYPQSQRYDRKSQHIDNVNVDHFEDAVQIAEQQDEYFMYTVTIDSVSSKSQALADLKITSDVCSRIVTCKLDTGADANIIPYNTLNTLVLDARTRLKPSTVRLIAFGNNQVSQLGVIDLDVTNKGITQKHEFYVTNTNGPVLLGLSTCSDLNLITVNNEVKKRPSDANLRQTILREYSDVFDGIGCFERECKITLGPNVTPVVHPPRRVPVALRDALKHELDNLVKQEILSPVTYPTDWVNSCVCVTKPNGKIRLCLDPKDLNSAIKRPHYVTPTLEDVLTRLNGAKCFSILDARSGYWNIKLDDKSADLTTFNTTFGRYQFNRLPMGVKCAQDEFQRMVDETFGDIPNTVGIADDLIVFGCTEEEHDNALHNVLQRARERGPKFNEDKMILKSSEILFFGHLIGKDGLRPDPAKVAAIQAMQPDNLQSLQTFLGMVNYLHRYSPNIADITAPLRDLCKRNIEFSIGPEHKNAIRDTKQAIANATHLPYYDQNKELCRTGRCVQNEVLVLL